MSELLKQLCPLNIIKTLGAEAIWLYSTTKDIREAKIIDLDEQEAFWEGEDLAA